MVSDDQDGSRMLNISRPVEPCQCERVCTLEFSGRANVLTAASLLDRYRRVPVNEGDRNVVAIDLIPVAALQQNAG